MPKFSPASLQPTCKLSVLNRRIDCARVCFRFVVAQMLIAVFAVEQSHSSHLQFDYFQLGALAGAGLGRAV